MEHKTRVLASRIVAVVVATNIVLVLAVSIMHFAGAQEQTKGPSSERVPPAEFTGNAAVPKSDADETETVESKTPDTEDPEIASDSGVESVNDLEIPTDLPQPEIPSESALKRDPVFKEFEKLFANEESPNQAESPISPTLGKVTVDGETLIRRLESAGKLTSSAQRIVQEANRLRQQGFSEQAATLINLAQEVGRVAADVLKDSSRH